MPASMTTTRPPLENDPLASPTSDDEELTSFNKVRNRSLFDAMEDDDDEEDDSPPKKKARRESFSDAALKSLQSFCRQGIQYTSLLSDAIDKVKKTNKQNKNLLEKENARPATLNTHQQNVAPVRDVQEQAHTNLAEILKEKTAKCILLQQEVTSLQTQKEQLAALNKETQTQMRQQAARIHKMNQSLQVASHHASQARQDADNAEATSVALTKQLHSLQVVVEDTKRASRKLLTDRAEIESAVRSATEKHIQSQAELTKSKFHQNELRTQNKKISAKLKDMEEKIEMVQSELEEERSRVVEWKQTANHLQARDTSNKHRMDRLEEKVHKAEALLLEATSTAAEAEATAKELQDTLEQLQGTNKALHTKLEETNRRYAQEKETISKKLLTAQRQVDTLRLEARSSEEQIQQLTLDKKAQEKRNRLLQEKIANLEKRLTDNVNVVPLASPTVATPPGPSQVQFSIPRLGKDKDSIERTCKCSICLKEGAAGTMRRCQCGNDDCQLRAHGSCASTVTAGPSVSHPGTPAPRLPVVLCGQLARKIAITPARGTN